MVSDFFLKVNLWECSQWWWSKCWYIWEESWTKAKVIIKGDQETRILRKNLNVLKYSKLNLKYKNWWTFLQNGWRAPSFFPSLPVDTNAFDPYSYLYISHFFSSLLVYTAISIIPTNNPVPCFDNLSNLSCVKDPVSEIFFLRTDNILIPFCFHEAWMG